MEEKEILKINENKMNSMNLEFLYNLGSLIFSIIFVHCIYLFSIRPNAFALTAIGIIIGIFFGNSIYPSIIIYLICFFIRFYNCFGNRIDPFILIYHILPPSNSK